MFKNKVSFTIVSILLVFAIVLSGCTKETSPKKALQESLSKSADLKSYSFKGQMKIEDFNFPDEEMEAGEAAYILNLFKSAELSWTGAYRADPMMTEINLQFALQGDLAVTFKIPIIITAEKVWVKVPNIPMLPIPEEITGKFIEFDLKKLEEMAGEKLPTMDVSKSQKFVKEITDIVFKHIEEEKYLSSVKVKEAGLPADVVDVKQVVQLHLDQSQIEPLFTTIVDKIAPEVLDLLSKNKEYLELTQLKQEDLDDAKKALAEVKDGEIAEGFAEIKKELKKLDFKVNYGFDKKNYPVYTDASFSMAIESEEATGSFGFKVVSQLSDINKEVKFEGEPKGDNVISMEQLLEQMGGMFGGESFDDSL
ncbi:hypothetical protein [Cohnella abietis]|uniref:Lipoprotein n=1 Tax=Cohnella abietis TaxID=2507935 RepID=A0A3T1CXY8_9BACL|nr:hypothetical protein [Cohnella abietis]BBI30703.1 hypothetical protein KCTCHS21_01020 [Cohnella abietis]